MSNYKLPTLPLSIDLETKQVLKKIAAARGALAELKGSALSIPNESILISTLSLQEAKDSSAIENIITTHDELYQADTFEKKFASIASKEVHSYAEALRKGFQRVKEQGILTNNNILEIQSYIEENSAGFRKLPGTALKNEQTGEVVYTPPQHQDEIVKLMTNLEQVVNDNSLSDLDPLVKMAIIHHQFESIHPFYDGNGRTGRIINILYLVKEDLLHIPILYLSRYINQNKSEYYRLLQKVRTDNAWEEWVLFMLTCIEQTSLETTRLIHGIKSLMQYHKQKLRTERPKIYSQDLLNNIFRHPYTKIEFVMKELDVSRITASKYLEELVEIDMLSKHRIWKESYYINNALFDLLQNVSKPKG
jgi:Fic family protein